MNEHRAISFPPLGRHGVAHAFTLRYEAGTALTPPVGEMLVPLGFAHDSFVQAQQPHGNLVACVGDEHAGSTVPDVDGLLTNEDGITLVIRTADCAPIFLCDPVHKVIGAVHSGRKGTEQAILSQAIDTMGDCYGCAAKDLIVVVGPCIRVPDYDVDFSGEIGRQAMAAGVGTFWDCGMNTAANLSDFYSYRKEKGSTGRHYAAISLWAY